MIITVLHTVAACQKNKPRYYQLHSFRTKHRLKYYYEDMLGIFATIGHLIVCLYYMILIFVLKFFFKTLLPKKWFKIVMLVFISEFDNFIDFIGSSMIVMPVFCHFICACMICKTSFSCKPYFIFFSPCNFEFTAFNTLIYKSPWPKIRAGQFWITYFGQVFLIIFKIFHQTKVEVYQQTKKLVSHFKTIQ